MKQPKKVYLYIISFVSFCPISCGDKYIKNFSQLTRWRIAGCENGSENVEKKSPKYLEIAIKCPYLCTRFERETLLRNTKTGSEKFWKKFRNLLEIQKNDLPLHPLRIRNTVRNDKRKGSENFWKNSFKKIWWFKKYDLSLHHFPLKNRGQNSGRGRKADPGEIKEIVLIVIYWTAFFEVFEQLKVFSTLAREWFQTIPLRLELKIYNKTFFTMESLILAQDER